MRSPPDPFDTGAPPRVASGRLLVFAKAPVPGLVKTRLIPVLGARGAAALQAAMIEHTLESCTRVAAESVELWCAPDSGHPFFQWCGERFGVILRDQLHGSLGRRMFGALKAALQQVSAAVLVGTDVPSLTLRDFEDASSALSGRCDAVLAPAFDGGYVLIGLRRVVPELFRNMPWGSDQVLEQTRQRLHAQGYRWSEIRGHHDIDRPEDWRRLIEQAPDWQERVIYPPPV